MNVNGQATGVGLLPPIESTRKHLVSSGEGSRLSSKKQSRGESSSASNSWNLPIHSPTKKKISPSSSRSVEVPTSSDREVIDGIRADLRAQFSLCRPPGLASLSEQPSNEGASDGKTDANGASSSAVTEVEVAMNQMSVQSSNDVIEVEGETNREGVQWARSDRMHTTTPIHHTMQGVTSVYTSTRGSQYAAQVDRRQPHAALNGRWRSQNRRNQKRAKQSTHPYSFAPSSNMAFDGMADHDIRSSSHGRTRLRELTPDQRQRALNPKYQQKKFANQVSSGKGAPGYYPELLQEQDARPEFVSIVGKVNFGQKVFNTEKRDGLLWVPCERCQHKGTRCSTCTVIRVGGGYIILENGDLTDREARYVRKHHPELMGDGGDLKLQSRPGTGFKSGWKVSGESSKPEDESNGRSSRLTAADAVSEEDGELDGGDMYDDPSGRSSRNFSRAASRQSGGRPLSRRSGSGGEDAGDNGDQSKKHGRPLTAKNSGNGGGGLQGRGSSNQDGSGGGGTGTGADGRITGGQGSERSQSRAGDSSDNDRGGEEDGDNTGNGKRRPPSAKKGPSGGRGLRQRHKLDVDTGTGGFHSARGGRESKSPLGGPGGLLVPDSKSSSQAQNRLKSAPPTPRAEDEVRRRKKGHASTLAESDGEYEDDEDGDDFDPKSRHKLRKFKGERYKKDSMGAKECDWKDLKGIDPLDYLAKYCIVDQDRIPTYERVYHNVDLDEDDEISLDQLDFALKAVNNNLITDPEMEFVHHVLELAHRPKLNFKLYCLVAALSERVVMLEDMVKKLVHKMDFGALEVKMKKVKELFYLLADMEHRGGVVTTGNLAIELTAGGLTPEHVKLVVNHLNREKKGLVQFLDYLTYVPLFLEIHGSIVSNPLDQNRDK